MASSSTPDPSQWLAHTRWVETLARSLVRDPDLAADLAQRTLLTALERAPDRAADPRGWLGKVMRNHASERGRRESARESVERRGAKYDALPGPDALVARAESERCVVEAVLALEEPHRSTLLLRYFEDLGPSEIAERSNTPLATVTSRITRAHARLRDELERRHGRREWLSLLAPILQRPRDGATELTIMSTSMKVLAGLAICVGLAWWIWPIDATNAESAPAATGEVALTTTDAKESAHEIAVADATRSAVEPVEHADEVDGDVATGATEPIAPLSTTGRIFGRVFRPDGQPATDRRVRLVRMNSGSEKSATTDASGFFDERELEPGFWSLATWPDKQELGILGKSGENTLGGFVYMAQRSVELERGNEVEVILGAPPVDGVRARGRLLSKSQSVGGLTTWLPDGRDAMDRQQLAVSSVEGGFDLVLEAAGRFSVIVVQGDTRVEFVVDVPPGAEFEHDFELPDLELRGRVVTSDGKPVVGARVELTPRGAHRPRHPSASITFVRSTKSAGEFSFRHLPGARYALSAHGGTYGDEKLPAAARTQSDVDLLAGPLAHDLVIVVGTGSTTRGVLVNDVGPCAGSSVFVFDDRGEPLNPLEGVTVDKDGLFELFSLAPGRYWAVAARGDRWSALTRFEVLAEPRAHSLELVLQPAATLQATTPGTESAWIDVRDANGVCFSALLDKQVFNRSLVRDWSTTNFAYFVPPGDYEVRVIGARGELERSMVNAR